VLDNPEINKPQEPQEPQEPEAPKEDKDIEQLAEALNKVADRFSQAAAKFIDNQT